MGDMKVHGPSSIRQALTYVVPQLNDHCERGWLQPISMAAIKMPRLPGGLAQDGLSAAQIGDHDQFEHLLRQRAAAKKALISADVDAKLRRALLRQYQGADVPPQVGQKCFFWRDHGK